MIDSGSVVSVVPPTHEERHAHDTEQRHLHAANDSLIKTFGTRFNKFVFMGRQCCHNMIIADVMCSILGTDFSKEGDGKVFVIDLAHQCLRDPHTSCAVQGSYRNIPVGPTLHLTTTIASPAYI